MAAGDSDPDDPLARLSAGQMQDLVRRLSENPGACEALAALHRQGNDMLRGLVEQAMRMLAAGERAQHAVPAGPIDLRLLAGAARERENAARNRRELAQDLVLGALINIDNPDWNPLDPATTRSAGDSALLAFLSMQPPAAGDGRR